MGCDPASFAMQRRDLSECCGPRTIVFNSYIKWGERGVWQRSSEALANECEDALTFIGGSIVRARCAAMAFRASLLRKNARHQLHFTVNAGGE